MFYMFIGIRGQVFNNFLCLLILLYRIFQQSLFYFYFAQTT